jgi:hypothetical protein
MPDRFWSFAEDTVQVTYDATKHANLWLGHHQHPCDYLQHPLPANYPVLEKPPSPTLYSEMTQQEFQIGEIVARGSEEGAQLKSPRDVAHTRNTFTVNDQEP